MTMDMGLDAHLLPNFRWYS